MTDFEVHATTCGDTSSLVLSGEADLAVADQIVQAGTDLLAGEAVRCLVIDLGDVTFIDSTTLGALVRLRNTATESNKQLQLARPPVRVRRLLQLTGLAGVFEQTKDGQDLA